MTKKVISKHSRKIRISQNRFGVCKKEYWFFDCVDLYKLLILLNCEFLGKCKTCTYIIRWIIDILMQKWDTIRFVDFDLAKQLASEIKILIYSSPLVDYYI